MESAPLNKAHEFGRKAVKCYMKGLFSEASNFHNKSASLLNDLSYKLPEDSPVIRSLLEQRKHHIRQAEFAIILKEMAERTWDMDVKPKQPIIQNPSKLRTPHYDMQKKFDEADSLIQILLVGANEKTGAAMLLQSATESSKGNFTVKPKNDAEVIEELQIVNSNLRSFVDQLLHELHGVREENKVLKKELELYKTNGSQLPQNTSAVSLQEIFEQLPVRSLPELTPLENPPEFVM